MVIRVRLTQPREIRIVGRLGRALYPAFADEVAPAKASSGNWDSADCPVTSTAPVRRTPVSTRSRSQVCARSIAAWLPENPEGPLDSEHHEASEEPVDDVAEQESDPRSDQDGACNGVTHGVAAGKADERTVQLQGSP